MDLDFDTVYERRGSDSSKWSRFDPDVIPMPVADMDFRSPEPVRQALADRVAHGFYGYAKVNEELLEVFSRRLERRYGWRVATEAIAPIPGVIAGINAGLRALTSPGDGVVVQHPSYPPILNSWEHHGLVRRDAQLRTAESGRYEIDWESFEAACAGSKAFILCNPHNPVGRVFSPEELRRMAEICLAHGLTIISDEIHCDLMLGGSKHTPLATLSPEIAANTITLMAPSKTFNLAGLKASLVIIENEDLRARFEKAKSGMVSAVNVLGMTAMLAAYRDCDEWLDGLTSYLTANRDRLHAVLQERMPGVRSYPAEGTYLAWLDCNALDLPGGDPFAWFLENARVGLGEGPNFGPMGEGFVRLNFGCPRALLDDGLDRMARALASRP
ncbi:MAG: pyridoxal phosphate-dependent aminotransferase [Dehalococcoidia bacterium]|nr:pyridoxal phosphate-dependent aminotransferase [Dehalococcoidia bacterium]